jgi:hypothetical protein
MTLDDLSARCPDCFAPVEGRASKCCPACHARRVARVHARDTADDYDPSPEDGRYHPPYERHVRPSASGRRVVRKSEPMAG